MDSFSFTILIFFICFIDTIWGISILLNIQHIKEIIESDRVASTELTGHWIRYKENCCYNKCSICEYEHCKESNYCPNCGCRMVEPQESEE